MTSAETQVRAAEAASYSKAILNILDDFAEERERQGDSQRAVINILEDIDGERTRLEANQKAILNILDDFDIERRRVEEANADLQMVNASMRSFTAVAAHDLRSPIASILGFATLLTSNWSTFPEESRRKFVAIIESQCRKLSQLVDDLFTLSSIEGGAQITRPELVVLAHAIDQCLELGDGDTAGVTVSSPSDLVVWIDPHHLGCILDNFLQNAFKYGEPPMRIEATRASDGVEVRFVDHGPGVPPEFASRLFGRFARADTPSTRAVKGSGLGLSIVRGLAEANGGQARYEPNTPNGACFLILLPAADGPRG
jgi:signal transduction histidine kinase